MAVHIASAWEIATDMQLAGGGGEAPSSDEEGGATACVYVREPALYFASLGALCLCLFVFVCVCVCTLE